MGSPEKETFRTTYACMRRGGGSTERSSDEDRREKGVPQKGARAAVS